MQHPIEAIGFIQSPYKQKFAIPRQPGLVSAARAFLKLAPPYDQPESLQGLEDFSHVWLQFLFHENLDKGWTAKVRPPRLGGNRKLGVFATRSSFRPNGLGLSVVRLDGIVKEKHKVGLNLSGIDLLDGTPVVDIKPYLPYADAIGEAAAGFAREKPASDMPVKFSDIASATCQRVASRYPELASLISQIIAQDPRPAYKRESNKVQSYSVTLYEFDVHWQVIDGVNHITDIQQL